MAHNYYKDCDKPKANRLNVRADHKAGHRKEFERNRKKILATQTHCAICGLPVDKNLKFPHPLSPTVDHIIPIHLGGHPSDIANLQLAHFTCNRKKGTKLTDSKVDTNKEEVIDNRNLPHTFDWLNLKIDD